jgi:hypothetical protein
VIPRRLTQAHLSRPHAEFQTTIIRKCRGLHVHHCGMLGSQRGFPDLVIIGPGGVLWRELKVPPDDLRSEQRALGYTLQACWQNWAVWTPADLDNGRIEEELASIKRLR